MPMIDRTRPEVPQNLLPKAVFTHRNATTPLISLVLSLKKNSPKLAKVVLATMLSFCSPWMRPLVVSPLHRPPAGRRFRSALRLLPISPALRPAPITDLPFLIHRIVPRPIHCAALLLPLVPTPDPAHCMASLLLCDASSISKEATLSGCSAHGGVDGKSGHFLSPARSAYHIFNGLGDHASIF